MEIEGLLLNTDSITIGNSCHSALFPVGSAAAVRLWLKTKEGTTITAIDRNFQPYFYMRNPPPELSGAEGFVRMEQERRKLFGKEIELSRIVVKHPGYVPKLRGMGESYEADVPFDIRYIIDKRLTPMGWVRASGRWLVVSSEGREPRIEGRVASIEGTSLMPQSSSLTTHPSYLPQSRIANPEFRTPEYFEIDKIEPIRREEMAPLKIMAFDIESFQSNGSDFMVIMGVGTSFGTIVQFAADSSERGARIDKKIIEQFVKFMKDEDPDVIVTYNGDAFDWPYLQERAAANGLRLNVGRDGSEPISHKGAISRVSVAGRANIDLYRVVERDLGEIKVKTLKLVAEALGIMRTDERVMIPHEQLSDYWETEEKRRLLMQYNKDDVVSTLGLADKLLPMQYELAKMTKQPLDEVTKMGRGRQVDWFLINEAARTGEVAPNKHEYGGDEGSVEGGFVLQPKPGLHENVSSLDFGAMYPSIMIAYNISPDTLIGSPRVQESKSHESPRIENRESRTENGESRIGIRESGFGNRARIGASDIPLPTSDFNEAPEVGHRFRKSPDGFFKRILQELITKRMEMKRRLKEMPPGAERDLLDIRQKTIKILTNSFYGYMGWLGARWYRKECAEATTAWGRHLIKDVMARAQAQGIEVFYGDSVTKERLITIRDSNCSIGIIPIQKLFNQCSTHGTIKIGGKEYATCIGYDALSVDPETLQPIWSPILHVMRHWIDGPVLRVNQKFGETVVTEDHSIITENNGKLEETKPHEMIGKKMARVKSIPRSNQIDYIDLYGSLSRYSSKSIYKKKEKKSSIREEDGWLAFGWTNRKNPVKIKSAIKVDSEEFESLCRLVGAYIPEGSSSTSETTESRFGASIASSDLKWLEQLKEDYLKLFKNSKASIIKSTKKKRTLTYKNTSAQTKTIEYEDGTYKLQMMNRLSAVFFKMLCGQKSHGKKLPDFAFNVPEKYQMLVLKHMIKGDGSVWFDQRYSKEYAKKNFSYTTTSYELACGLSLLISQLGFVYTIQYIPSKRAYTFKTSTKFNSRIATRITEEEYHGYVYDIEVRGAHNFVDSCGQVLLHNTDSVFCAYSDKIQDFVKQINDEFPVDLELQDIYKVIFFTGAKKRYAGLTSKGETVVRGLEVRRGDWCLLAKQTQQTVIDLLLRQRDPAAAVNYVKDVVNRLRNGNFSTEELTIYKTMTRAASSYETKQAHVKAAMKAIEQGIDVGEGGKIAYVVLIGKGIVSERTKLVGALAPSDKLDINYYIDKQIVPAALRILEYFGYGEADLKGAPKQQGLERWF